MFRKPTKKIQRRVFNGAEDDDEGEPEPPPPPVISKQKKENKPLKSKSLLSFADEEEDSVEVFKVKKSSQSKRLAKKREKEKKHANSDSKYENDIPEEKQPITEQPKKKKVTLEGLILSGREALAADGTGDVSDEPEDCEEEAEEDRGFHRYRAESVRAALAAGGDPIPDAALIHAARKTRQQARELGGDYVSVRPESERAGAGSRLVRDDASGDEDEDGRIHVRGLDLPSDKPKRTTAAAETEMDSEAEEWEEQQMQKAVPAISDVAGGGDMNPFAMAPPPPPRMADGPPHLRPLAAPAGAPATTQQLVDALRLRLQELQTDRERTHQKRIACESRLTSLAEAREERSGRAAPLEAAYRRAQAARAYVTDLVECLDEKMPELEALEARALALARGRCSYLQERRRADVRDQAQDVSALAARPGSVKQQDSEDKVRRTAEREGRRRARRLKREASGTANDHREGDSSDDELPPAEAQHAAREREAIRRLSEQLFADALPAWRSIHGVCAKMARWRRRDPQMYNDAYVAECLPKLVSPYVRQQLILWNPFADEDNEDFERMDWYKCLMMYGVRPERVSADSSDSDSEGEAEGAGVVAVTEDSVRNDMDLYLVPTVVHRVVLPKITELIEHTWDPMCVRACVRLRHVVAHACSVVPRAPPALRRLGQALRAALARAVADVFLPPLPPQLQDGPGGAFWRRCLGASVRLLRAIICLCPPPDVLKADAMALQLIGTLCTAAGAAPGPSSAAAAVALASTLPRGPLRAPALRRIAGLAELAVSKLQADNPMHLKALEQARAVIAEAKACQKLEEQK